MRRAHGNSGEPFAGSMHEARSNRHQGFTRAAFCDHLGGFTALLPELESAHDGKRLGRERFPLELREERRERVFWLVERLIRISNSLPEVRSVLAQVIEYRGECCH